MAKVVNVPRDERFGRLGQGLGNLLGAVIKNQTDTEKKRKTAEAAAETLSAVSALGSDITEEEAAQQDDLPAFKSANALMDTLLAEKEAQAQVPGAAARSFTPDEEQKHIQNYQNLVPKNAAYKEEQALKGRRARIQNSYANPALADHPQLGSVLNFALQKTGEPKKVKQTLTKTPYFNEETGQQHNALFSFVDGKLKLERDLGPTSEKKTGSSRERMIEFIVRVDGDRARGKTLSKADVLTEAIYIQSLGKPTAIQTAEGIVLVPGVDFRKLQGEQAKGSPKIKAGELKKQAAEVQTEIQQLNTNRIKPKKQLPEKARKSMAGLVLGIRDLKIMQKNLGETGIVIGNWNRLRNSVGLGREEAIEFAAAGGRMRVAAQDIISGIASDKDIDSIVATYGHLGLPKEVNRIRTRESLITHKWLLTNSVRYYKSLGVVIPKELSEAAAEMGVDSVTILPFPEEQFARIQAGEESAIKLEERFPTVTVEEAALLPIGTPFLTIDGTLMTRQ